MKKLFIISIFMILFIGIIFSGSVFAKEVELKEKKIPGFNLTISNKLASSDRMQTLSSKNTQNEYRVVITLKEPSSIPEWKKEVSNFKEEEIKILKSTMREYVIQTDFNSSSVKNKYNSFNGFSAIVNQQELYDLQSNPLVKKVDLDERVYAFLQESVPLINATTTWTRQVYGINLTGKGQTICIIDSGVDYTHPDLGGCSPTNIGTRTIEQYSLTSPNFPSNYTDNYDHTWTITRNGYSRISVYFAEFDVEKDEEELYWFDYVDIMDSNNNIIQRLEGNLGSFWSPSVEGDTIKIHFHSDAEIHYKGFNISAIVNATTDSTKNWSSCSKVIGGHDFVNSDSDPIDDLGHGTHCAGIVAANGSIKGVAPETKIFAVKAIGSGNTGWDSDIIAGIEYCTEVASRYNISVISMSLGGGLYPNYCDSIETSYAAAINAAASAGISVVVATGNNGNSTHISAPACIQNAIPISSTNKTDSLSSFSNRNNLVKLFAPGSNIYSTVLGNSYQYYDGTSMATPHVAGAIAIINQYLRSIGQTRTTSEIENILWQTGVKINDSTNLSQNFSRINIYSALNSICLTNLTNTSWQKQENLSVCRTNNTILYNWSMIQYDASNCGFNNNITFYKIEEDTCDYCTPNILNQTDYWINESIYLNDTIIQKRNTTQYDSNYCNETENLSWIEYQTIYYDYCTPNWTSIQENNFNWYNDTNNCYEQTNLSSDLFGRPINITVITNENLTEIYDDENDSIIVELNFNLSNSNNSINVLNITKQNNTYNFSYTIVKGLNLTGNLSWMKTVFVDKILGSGLFCLIDSEEVGLGNFSRYCNTSSSEKILKCPGNNGNYTCSDNGTKFKIEGLRNSGIKEIELFCGDETCNNGETCSTCSSDCGECSGSPGGGGGGGGGGSTPVKLTEYQLSQGYSKKYFLGEKISFLSGGQNHSIQLNKIINNSVNITIRSEPINLILQKGEEKKINLSSSEYYDFYIKVENVTKNTANITIRSIAELINPLVKYDNSTENNVSNKSNENNIFENTITQTGSILPIYALLILTFLIAIYFLLKRIFEKKTIEKE